MSFFGYLNGNFPEGQVYTKTSQDIAHFKMSDHNLWLPWKPGYNKKCSRCKKLRFAFFAYSRRIMQVCSKT